MILYTLSAFLFSSHNTTMDENNENNENKTCPLCAEPVTAYANYECNHWICMNCSIKNLFIKKERKKKCAFCRESIDEVHYTEKYQTWQDNSKIRIYYYGSRIGDMAIWSETRDMQIESANIRNVHKCTLKENPEENPECKVESRYLDHQIRHMWKEHALTPCTLCQKNLAVS